MEAVPVISLRRASKRFGPVLALQSMTLDLFAGEVHVLLGENGAGKSTLVNLLIGTYPPDGGQLLIRGREVAHHTPANARREGVNVVLQDFSLAPTLDVVENLFLGREVTGRGGVVDRTEMKKRARDLLEMVGASMPLNAEVGVLPRAEQQLVEIMKALMGQPGALLLDEPTAALSEHEAGRLYEIVDRLKGDGWAILYITHRMAEVRRLGNRVTVMRDGQHVGTHALADVTDAELIQEMVGRPISAVYPVHEVAAPDGTYGGAQSGQELLRMDRVSSGDGKVRDVSMRLHGGEIVGVAGLVGCGKAEVARLLFGLQPMSSGTVTVLGQPLTRISARKMISLGVGFMPEDRKRESLALERSVEENINLEAISSNGHRRFGFLNLAALARTATGLIESLDIRPVDARQEVGRLSGGNQQKVVLARALTRSRKVFVVSEPTAGVDVGARQEIYRQLRQLCDEGAGVLCISSDLEEVVGIADRVYVMNGGCIQSELAGDAITREIIVADAFSHRPTPTGHEGE
jgi:ribose transport system ATP-binding protein